MSTDLFNNYGVRVKLISDFMVVKETLTRMGFGYRAKPLNSEKLEPTLVQSCHLLHKRGEYCILHFKELFALDGKSAFITEEDIGRRNTIAELLNQWGLVEILTPIPPDKPRAPQSKIKIVKHDDVKNWKLVAKYTIGNK